MGVHLRPGGDGKNARVLPLPLNGRDLKMDRSFGPNAHFEVQDFRVESGPRIKQPAKSGPVLQHALPKHARSVAVAGSLWEGEKGGGP